MVLYINTADFNLLELALISDHSQKNQIKELAFNENYKTLALLEKFLRHHKVKPVELTKIIVCSGPGSFTGIRVGISLAQALGYALNIPVKAIPKKLVPEDYFKFWNMKLPRKMTLHYGAKPNITAIKKKTRKN